MLSGLILHRSGWRACRSCAGLQKLNSLGENLVRLFGFIGLLYAAGIGHRLFIRDADDHGGGYSLVFYLFAFRGLVLGNSEEEDRAVRQVEGLLHCAFAEGALAEDIAALEVADGGSGEFGCAVGSAIDEDDERSVGDGLGWIGSKCFKRDTFGRKG